LRPYHTDDKVNTQASFVPRNISVSNVRNRIKLNYYGGFTQCIAGGYLMFAFIGPT
jgi:hypothetical protein